MNKEEAKQFLMESLRQKPVQKAQSIEDPARLAISIFNKHIKNKMLFPASGHFQTPNQAKMWFADQAGKFGMNDLKEQALNAKSYDDIQKLGQLVVEDKSLTDKIINGIALGITDKKNAREWNPVEKQPNYVYRGRVTENERDIEGELRDRGQWEGRGGGAAESGYGAGPVGIGPDSQGGGGGEGPSAGQAPAGGPQQPGGGGEGEGSAADQQGEEGELGQEAMSEEPDPTVEQTRVNELINGVKRFMPPAKATMQSLEDPSSGPVGRKETDRPVWKSLPSWFSRMFKKDI